MARARSVFKQVRLTVTEETGGRVTVRILVKPVDADWQVKHSVYHHSWLVSEPTPHWLDLLAHAYRAVGLEALPRDE